MTAEAEAAAAPAGRIEDLYVRYAPDGFRLAYLLLGDRQAAEDCLQDAFIRVIGRLGHIRSSVAFDAYLRRTIVNLAKNTWRRRSVERSHASAASPGRDDVPSAEGAALNRLMVWRAVLELPPRQRIAIVLRFYEDLPEDQIAMIMRCPPGTARSLVARGIATLRDVLEVRADA